MCAFAELVFTQNGGQISLRQDLEAAVTGVRKAERNARRIAGCHRR